MTLKERRVKSEEPCKPFWDVFPCKSFTTLKRDRKGVVLRRNDQLNRISMYSWTCLDSFGPFWTGSLALCGLMSTFGPIRTFLDLCTLLTLYFRTFICRQTHTHITFSLKCGKNCAIVNLFAHTTTFLNSSVFLLPFWRKRGYLLPFIPFRAHSQNRISCRATYCFQTFIWIRNL